MTDNSRSVLVIGCGGHARFVLSMLRSSIYQVAGLIDLRNDFDATEVIMGVGVIGGLNDLDGFLHQGIDKVVLAIGDNGVRKKIYEEVVVAGFSLPNISHPMAFVDVTVSMGNGNVVGPGAVIGAQVVLGNNNIINSASVVEHQTVVGDHCHIAPSATISGGATIGDEVMLGANSTVIDRVRIASQSILGAGSTLLKSSDVVGLTLVGSPAREIKR